MLALQWKKSAKRELLATSALSGWHLQPLRLPTLSCLDYHRLSPINNLNLDRSSFHFPHFILHFSY